MAQIRYQIFTIPYIYNKGKKQYLISASYLKYYDIANRGMIFTGIKSIKNLDGNGTLVINKELGTLSIYSKIALIPAIFLMICGIFSLIFAIKYLFNGNILLSLIFFGLTFVSGYLNSEIGMITSKYFLFTIPKKIGWICDEFQTLILNEIPVITRKTDCCEAYRVIPVDFTKYKTT